jgi:hypothetical protein
MSENMLRLSLGKAAFPVDVRHAGAPNNVPAILDRGDTAATIWEVRFRMLGLPASGWG